MLSVIQKQRRVLQIADIKTALSREGKTKSGLAKAIGVRNSAVTELLNGERRLQREEEERAKEYLGLNVVPIVGAVGAGAEMHFYAEGQAAPDTVKAPDEATASTVAVEIRGTSLGTQFDGWLAFYDDRRSPVTPDLEGRLCVVGLDDGRVLIKTLRKAPGRSKYHLLSDGANLLDQKVSWAAKVKAIKPRS